MCGVRRQVRRRRCQTDLGVESDTGHACCHCSFADLGAAWTKLKHRENLGGAQSALKQGESIRRGALAARKCAGSTHITVFRWHRCRGRLAQHFGFLLVAGSGLRRCRENGGCVPEPSLRASAGARRVDAHHRAGRCRLPCPGLSRIAEDGRADRPAGGRLRRWRGVVAGAVRCTPPAKRVSRSEGSAAAIVSTECWWVGSTAVRIRSSHGSPPVSGARRWSSSVDCRVSWLSVHAR